ncbi:MAG TPA: hypothetical protein VGG40_07775 [Solirubrobacterales bacterium]|jgi:hypothetical protein
MATMAREARTDQRLDDLNAKVDRGFTEARREFDATRGEVRELRAEIWALNRTIHQFLSAIVGAIFLGFVGTIAALVSIV